MPICGRCGKQVESSDIEKCIDQFNVEWYVCHNCKNDIEQDKIKFNNLIESIKNPRCYFNYHNKRSFQLIILSTLMIIGGIICYLGILSFNYLNLTEDNTAIPIIFLAAGFSLMCMSLFFYKKGIVYWGYFSPFIAHKAEKTSNPSVFWFLLTTHFVSSVDAIIIGFYIYFIKL